MPPVNGSPTRIAVLPARRRLYRVEFTLDPQPELDYDMIALVEMARQ